MVYSSGMLEKICWRRYGNKVLKEVRKFEKLKYNFRSAV